MAGAPWHLVAEGNWTFGSCSSLRESTNIRSTHSAR